MFDVGFAELLLVFVLGLLILGPERLPRVAAQLGRWVSRARRTAGQLRRQLEREIELAELAEQKRLRPPVVPPVPTPAATASDAGESAPAATEDETPQAPTPPA
jgi:Tat protein translocase TatB subunit